MSKVRVYEVARQLGMKNRELVALFQSLGFNEVRNHMSAVEADVVERVKRKIERRAAPAVVEERISATVVKRRGNDRKKVAPPSAPAAEKPAPPARAPRRVARPAPTAAPKPPADDVQAAPTTAPETTASPTAAPTAAEAPTATPPPPEDKPEVRPAAVAEAEASLSGPGRPAPPSSRGTAEPKAAVPEPAVDEPRPEPRRRPTKDNGAAAEPEPHAAAVAEPEPPKPAAASKPPSAPPAEEASAGAEGAADPSQVAPRRTTPPKSGIEVWGGRPGVPMPQRPARPTGPPSRRTTYDPRANAPARRPAGPGYRPTPGGGGGRPAMRPGFRPGQRRFGPSRRGPVDVSTKEMSARKMNIKIEGEISLQAFAAKLSMKATDVLMKLLSMGMGGVHINSTLDVDTAKLLGDEFGWSVENVAVDEEQAIVEAIRGEDEELGEATHRPPIVTVMGHVDHGKTTLLDYIRKASVASGEAGGITQHIGAYRVETKKGVIAFLDTPGHEAFTAMRMRGASVTDIVILVVAADDGVMPQTREAINHARSAGVPIIVAVNKIDKPGVDTDRLMRDLANEGLQSEEWGGETIFCRVSAKTGEGVDQLLEMVLLQAEVLELQAHHNARAQGVVVEALLDRGRGPVARVLVQDGTLVAGDILLAGHAYGKVRAMTDEKGRKVKSAGPATPVEVLGLSDVPQAGDPVHAVKDIKAAETIADERRKRLSSSSLKDSRQTFEALTARLAAGEQLELKIIVKGDVQGSVEALVQALTKLSTPKVKLVVVHTGVGGITETDVNLAVAARAIILGFNVRPAGKAKKLAESEGIEIRLYSIIYECIDEVRSAMEGLLPATKVEKELGRAQVRRVFRISKVGPICGCMVQGGIIRRGAEARLVRDDVVIWSGRITSLRRFKEDAREVREGFECGIGLENYGDAKDGDIIEAFEIEEVKATL